MLFQAEQCPYLPKKIELYCAAIQMCKMYGLFHQEAIIHCKLFRVTFHTMNSPHLAIEHARNAIRADPEYGEVS